MLTTSAGPFELRATITGSGSTVMLIHSSGIGPAMWRAYQEPLGDGHRVVTPALLGYSPSDLVPRGSTGLTARDLEGLGALLAAEPGPVHLVGHSYGGFLAARLALAQPEKVATLALLEPVMFGALRLADDPVAEEDLSVFQANRWFEDVATAGSERWMELFVDYWNQAGAWQGLPPSQKAVFLAAGWKVFEEVRAVLHDPWPFADYRFAMPTLLLRGGRSTKAARQVVAHLAAMNPSARTVELPLAGHMFPVTHWRDVVSRLGEHWGPAL